MDPDVALVPPPGLNIDGSGPIAQALRADGRLATAPKGPAPTAVFIDESAVADPAALAGRIEEAGLSGTRVWLVVPDLGLVTRVEQVVAADAPVDAILVLDVARPDASALALVAWTWLRHDAPPNSFATLQDVDGGTCRWALAVSAAPAQAPPTSAGQASTPQSGEPQDLPRPTTEQAEHSNGHKTEPSDQQRTSRDQAEHSHGCNALRDLRETLHDVAVEQAASELAHHQGLSQALASVDQVASDLGSGTAAGAMTRWAEEPPAFLSGVSDALAAAHSEGTPEASAPVEGEAQGSAVTRLPAAALTLGEKEAAVAAELSRTGWTARMGRKRRLDALEAARTQAQREWEQAFTAAFAERADRAATAELSDRLPAVMRAAEQSARSQAEHNSQSAYSRWLSGALATVRTLAVPPVTSVDRAWGRSSPNVRRHLLLPDEPATPVPAPHDTEDTVVVHRAPGIERPIAAAIVLGLPASSLPQPQDL